MSWGMGGGGNSVLLGLLMSPSPIRVRSATCSSSTVWMPPASTSGDSLLQACVGSSCTEGMQEGFVGFSPGRVVPGGPGGLWVETGLWAEPGLQVELGLWAEAGLVAELSL